MKNPPRFEFNATNHFRKGGGLCLGIRYHFVTAVVTDDFLVEFRSRTITVSLITFSVSLTFRCGFKPFTLLPI